MKQVKDRETVYSHAQVEVNETDLGEERREVVITTACGRGEQGSMRIATRQSSIYKEDQLLMFVEQ